MIRGFWVGIVVLGIGFPVLGLGLGGAVGVGLVEMAFLNRQLEFSASQSGTTFSPIRFAREVDVYVWPWSFAGASVTWLSAEGTTHGREPRPQGVTAWAASPVARLDVRLFGWPIGVEGALTLCWVGTSGIVEGGGWGWGGHVSVSAPLLAVGRVQLAVAMTWRYLPVASLYDVRGGRIETRGDPGADFSGLYLGVAIGWR